MPKTIPNQVLKSLLGLARNAGAELLKEPGRMTEAVAGKTSQGNKGEDAVLGKITPVSLERLQKIQSGEEKATGEELAKLREEMGIEGKPSEQGGARDVQKEIQTLIRNDEVQKREEEKEQAMLEALEANRRKEARMASDEAGMVSGNPHKQRKSRGSAFLPGKKTKGSGETLQSRDN